VSVLGRIADGVRARLPELRRLAGAWAARADAQPPARDFAGALTGDPGLRVIAEFKPASPSRGSIRPDADVRAFARAFEAGGAAAMSVLTEPEFFGSGLDRLEAARTACSLPLLRKDFLLDPVQIDEARASGADAVLLIVALLDDARLRDLMQAAAGRGMASLVEAHDRAEAERALTAGAGLLGVNQRNLNTFEIDPGLVERMLPTLPRGVPVVAESGLRSREDLRRLHAAGCRAFLVGTTLMEAPDPAAALRGWLA
jgi:indole-3-glycerol phosphate synthase